MSNHSIKRADTAHPVEPEIANRWSPYVFASRPVAEQDLQALFEAARWAPSSYNEQPWRYVVARKENSEDFERLLGVLVPANQDWAKHAPVLALGLAKKTFSRSGKPNRVALHDLGAASANLCTEATARGLSVHQMGGLDTAKAHAEIGAPEDFEVVTAIAIGYAGEEGDAELLERDAKPRTRKPLEEIVFQGKFGS